MSSEKDPQRQADRYFEPCIGAEITHVAFDGTAYWFHLSDGSMLECAALHPSGFDITLHPPES